MAPVASASPRRSAIDRHALEPLRQVPHRAPQPAQHTPFSQLRKRVFTERAVEEYDCAHALLCLRCWSSLPSTSIPSALAPLARCFLSLRTSALKSSSVLRQYPSQSGSQLKNIQAQRPAHSATDPTFLLAMCFAPPPTCSPDGPPTPFPVQPPLPLPPTTVPTEPSGERGELDGSADRFNTFPATDPSECRPGVAFLGSFPPDDLRAGTCTATRSDLAPAGIGGAWQSERGVAHLGVHGGCLKVLTRVR